jgi:RNA polymerase sigma-70 factor, ECF subfamily
LSRKEFPTSEDAMILPFPSPYPARVAGIGPRVDDTRRAGATVLANADADPTLEGLYQEHARHVAEVAFRLMGNDRDLDDVVQETFLDVSAGLSDRDRSMPVSAWVLMLAVRRVRRLFAKRRRFRLFGFRWLETAKKVSDPRGQEPNLDLYEALSTLDEDLRIPFCLHRIEQLTLPETALACEVSLATVKRRIAEAEERLSRRLDT